MDTAVMIMAYGGPRSLDEVAPFLHELMGREPSPELLERVRRRYLTIGGQSPLPEVVDGIAGALEKRLDDGGHEIAVLVGFRYSTPRISETLRLAHEFGARRVLALSLSPFESETTSVAYRRAFEEASEELPGLTVIEAPPISTMREFELVLAGGLAVALEHLPREVGKSRLAIFTAHSLPVDDLPDPDPYCPEVRRVAAELARGLGMDPGADFSNDSRLPGISAYGALGGELPWILAFQSKGERPGEWLGPDISEVLDCAAEAGIKGVAVQPIGFATDHLETLYDLDVEAAGRALDLGLEFSRGSVPNDSPEFIEGLEKLVSAALGLQSSSEG